MVKHFFFLIFIPLILCSCETLLEGMAQGMGSYGGYGMYGYPSMYGGYAPSNNLNYLLDPNYAVQQVLNEEQQEYQAAKQYRPGLTLEQYRAEKGQAIQNMQSGNNGSSTSSSSSSSSGNYNSSSGSNCRVCGGSGVCRTCNGKGWHFDDQFGSGRKFLCPNCLNHNGKCSLCGGTGKKR